MPAIDTAYFLPDGSPTDLQAGDEVMWDPAERTLTFTRLMDDGQPMAIHVQQANGAAAATTTLAHADGMSFVEIELFIIFLTTPLKPVLLPQPFDCHVFRLDG